jgi:hypothetical protein
MSPAIHARNLTKIYTVTEREAGVAAALRSLVRRHTRGMLPVYSQMGGPPQPRSGSGQSESGRTGLTRCEGCA